MAVCLVLGGVETEMAIEDLNEQFTTLVTGMLAQGVDTQELLRTIESVANHMREELTLLNARTEEAFETKLDEKDIT